MSENTLNIVDRPLVIPALAALVGRTLVARRALCAAAFLLLSVAATGCAVTSHPTADSTLGKPANGDTAVAGITAPGPITVTRVVSASWAIDREGLINLDHPTAEAAHLEDGDEPIEIYFYVVEHPQHGTFLVDSGVSAAFEDEDTAPVSWLVASQMGFDKLDIQESTESWLDRHGPVDGVFLTHLHLDHVMGLLAVPADVPVYVGPGEADASSFLNMFVQGTTDGLLEHLGPLQELQIQPDASGRFAGIHDIFGDGSFYAIHTPGHTPGNLAFLARTPNGPVLMAGDNSHTSWGWEHSVEPGTFTADHEANAESLAQLKRLEQEIPGLTVYLGHQ